MIIGLPHSSQSMSVVVPLIFLVAEAATGLSPRILAIISWLLAASSLSNGISASTCASSSPASFLAILVLRHLGKVLQPRNGPRLLSRRSIGLPHFSHL